MDSILGGLKTFYPEIGDHDPDKYAMALREGPYRLEPRAIHHGAFLWP